MATRFSPFLKKLVEQVIEDAIASDPPTAPKVRKLKKLRVFDFDDTIAKTKNLVRVTKADGTKLALVPGEYAVYRKEPGDTFDYSDFQDLRDPSEIPWMTKILRNVVQKHGNDAAVILTARGLRGPVEKFFELFQLPKIPIVALNDSDPETKAQWILYVILKHKYDVVEFFDDSPRNVAAVQAISSKVPQTKIISRLVKHVVKEQASPKSLKAYRALEKQQLSKARPDVIKGPFNFQEFKSIPAAESARQHEYMSTRTDCKLIGQGSSRVVYAIGENLVLKLARSQPPGSYIDDTHFKFNRAGKAQNKAEVQSTLYALGRYVAEIIDYDKSDFSWLIVERAEAINRQDFERLTGISFNNFNRFLGTIKEFDFDYKEIARDDFVGEEIVQLLKTNKWFAGFVKLFQAGDLMHYDLEMINQWGAVKDKQGEHVVLVDYGFNSDVFRDFYN